MKSFIEWHSIIIIIIELLIRKTKSLNFLGAAPPYKVDQEACPLK